MLLIRSPRLTSWPRPSWCAVLACLLLAVTLCACSSLPSASKPPLPSPPLPRAAALTHDSPESLSYSERARAWLKKAADTLQTFEINATPFQPATERTP